MVKKYPFFLKSTVILFGLILLTYALFNLREILVPLSFALMLSILLNPVTFFLQKLKFPRMLAIAVAILLAMILIAGVFYFLFAEISNLSTELPVFKRKFAQLMVKAQIEVSQQFGVNLQKQNQYIDEAENGMKPFLANAMGTALGTLTLIILLPVYSFLFLYYKTLILNFLYDVFAEADAKEVRVVLVQTKGAIQNYMFGLILEGVIVASLNTIALLLLGVKYALLLGFLGALINVLPFIGGIVAVLLPILIATVTKDGFQTQIGIIIAYLIIQFIDNHFLIPYIVSSRVKINALISIIIVLLGGALWGISGMFLSIPFIGVLKIIFDRVPELQPWGRLVGDEIPTRIKGRKIKVPKIDPA
ncbi:MAG: AI-2E family transporter [Aquabacterium sp.]|nr:AI-2E family transporter [Ferruginibacter sp.]